MTEQQKLKKATYHLWTFLISKLMGSLGAGVYAFGMSMFILSVTGSSLSFATNILLSILPRTLIAPIAGVIGDRVPRKLLVIGGQTGIVLTMAGLLSYTLAFDISVTAIYVATVFNSIFGTFSGLAFTSSIAILVDEARLQKAMSFNHMAYSVAGIGGPIVGGLLFGFVSMEVFLVIYLVSQLIALSLESTMNFNLYKKVVKTVAEKKETMVESFKGGIAYIKQKPLLIALLSTSFGLNFFFTSLSVGGDFALLTIIKLSTEQIGFTEAAGGIGVIVASIFFASTKAVKNPLLLSKYSILGMSTLVILAALPIYLNLPKTGDFIYYVILMFSFGITNIMTNMPIGVLFQKTIDDEYRSRVFSILETISMSLMPLATLIYGVLFDFLPAEYIFIFSGLCLIVLTLITLRPSVIKMVTSDETPEQQESAESSYKEAALTK